MQTCHITLTVITNQDALYLGSVFFFFLGSVFNLLKCIHAFYLLHYQPKHVKVAFSFEIGEVVGAGEGLSVV